MHTKHNTTTLRILVVLTSLLSLALVLPGCGGSGAPQESATAYLFLSPSDMSVAPGQSIEVEFDIANLPAGDAASGYAISLSEETTRIRIDPAPLPCDSGTVSCRRWTIRPDADAPAGDYAFVVRASGTRTPVEEAHARIRVVPIAQAKAAVKAASAQHVITADGRLWARGANGHGQTGAGFESVGFDPNDPFILPDFIDPFVQVGTDTDWSAVVSAGNAAVALKQDGTVWGWGANPEYNYAGASADPPGVYHQFVLPSARNLQLRPRQIPGLADIIAVSAIDLGEDGVRFLALTADGKLYGFGGGVDPRYDMRLPNTLKFPSTDLPLLVPRVVQQDGTQTPLTGVRKIAGGVRNSGNGWAVALLDDGSVVQMGRPDSTFFRLDGGIEGVKPVRGMPFTVAGLPPNAIAVTVGSGGGSGPLYSLAATQDGSVWSWTEPDSAPQRVTGFSEPIVDLDASGNQVTALDRRGGVWRWVFGSTEPQRVSGLPVMSRLAHRGTEWAISGTCASGRGELWNTRDVQRVTEFGKGIGDNCAQGDQVRLTLAKVGSGTVSLDPLDITFQYVCGAGCTDPVSLTVYRRDALQVRATAAPGWFGPSFNAECRNGQPLLDTDTTCTATFEPIKREGALTVEVSGAGRVTSSPAGIDCGTDCSEIYALGTVITLTPVAEPGSAFLRWSGASHTNERDCRDGTVTMNVIYDSSESRYPLKKCIAIFGPLPQLRVVGSPGGTVISTPPGIDCGAVCAQPFTTGTQINLSAVANAGFRFDGFSEAECRAPITLTHDLRCTPVFTSTVNALLTVNVIGDGRVTSADTFIDCARAAGLCAHAYAVGTVVSLSATASPGWAFSGWSSDCSGGSASLDAARVCSATFLAVGWQPAGAALSPSSTLGMAVAVDYSAATGPVLYAATAQSGAGSRIELLVRRFEGNNWVTVGGNLIEPGAVSNINFTPSLVIDSGGRMTVAWAENEQRIRVKQWSGTDWVSLGDNLNIDPAAQVQVFGAQLAVSGSGSLVAAWIEASGNVSAMGRMALKRYNPVAQTWVGDRVLPAENGVLALRLTSEALGQPLLMFVPFDASAASFEGPLRVVRQDNFGAWSDVCTPLSRASARGVFYPNSQIGFGIAQSGPTRGPVAIFNNGEALFAVKCGAAGWTGLDGSAQGQVAAAGPGEALYALSVQGTTLAWTKANFPLSNGNREFSTQVLAENPLATALVERGSPLVLTNTTFAQKYLAHTFLSASSPVLAGPILEDGAYAARVYRFVP
jgi:hypothetical protein